ncbi:hypothetical protein CDV50_06500 [Haematobacter massiliensis]|uniref:Uncharacterized protein n=1 Tax=Haematobacter massiliensis TaxID=195105 RepID=A0A086YD92_9RHOB|nr:PRC-barrel domain-containing protein [Haematobacter massiliensis]KFI32242.1 hypothetical protein CN97_07240 [Haematobacter massiliensis]OWJ72785.1 hypothetical protein CDV50_06500 [Haematobacter massiliensis]OWJ85828.1 hypothetical protein CDV51_11385 [Haematobacter massiliensis]QBJ24572.1 PRC-barrel domain containing protein [Haematobacter massiliensis]
MKKLLVTTAIVAMTSLPALAQTAPAGGSAVVVASETVFLAAPKPEALYADDLIGKRLYTSDVEVEVNANSAELYRDWHHVGNINDLVMSRDGSIEAVLVDVGGFLGIGARTVAVNMDSIRIIPDGENPSDYFLVFTATREALENAPEYQRPERMSNMEAATNATGAAATGAAATGAAASTGWMEPNEGYERVLASGLTAEQIKGVNVYDANNVDVGKVSDLVMSADGHVQQVIVDVGGFLGIGAKPVALPFNEMDVHKQVDGDTYRVYVSMTKEQLEALPRHES